MIFKSIVLENFRPYYGKVKFEFCSGEKNITLLKAENGSGKTTLLEAMKWVLYGGDLNLTGGSKQFGASSFVNKKHIAESNGTVSARVILTIVGRVSEEMKEQEYTIAREITFRNDTFVETKLILQCNGGEINSQISEYESQEIINRLLPKEIDFFVDGERLEKIAPEKDNITKIRNESVNVLKESINRVLGIKSLENAVNDIDRVYKELDKEYLESSKNEKNIIELSEKIEKMQQKEKRQVFEQGEKNKEIEVLKEQKKRLDDEFNEKLSAIEKDTELKSQVEELQKNKKEFEKDEDILKVKYKNFLSTKGVEIISSKILENAFTIISGKKEKGEIPSKYEKEFLEELLELKTCICGCSLEEGTENYKKIKEKLKNASTKDDREKINEVFFILKNRDTEDKLEKLNIYKKELAVIIKRKHETSDTLEVLLTKFNYNLQVEYEKMKKSIDEKETKINSLSREIGALDLSIENTKKQLNSLLIEKQEADKKNKKCQRERMKKDFAEKILNALESLKKYKEAQGRKELKDKIEEVYSKINKKGYQVELTEDFTFKIFDTDKKEAGTSKGEAKNKALSFIGGLIYYAKELNKKKNKEDFDSNGGIYPLVLDAPYGDLDNEYRLDFTKMLPILSEQIIVMVSSGQWNSQIESVVKDQIGKEYILENERRTGEDKKYDITKVREVI